MAEQLSLEDLTEFIDSLRSTISCIWSGRITNMWKEQTRILVIISLSQNSSLADLFETLEVSFAVLLRKTSDFLNASSFHQKEKTSIVITCKYRRKIDIQYYKENDRATAWHRNELEKYSNMSCSLGPNTLQTEDQVWSGKHFHRHYRWRIRRADTADSGLDSV